MKLTTEKRDILRTGKFREKGFKLEESSLLFDLLSSKIYKDPILAIVRELSTNAIDSHIDAGTADQPFAVRLPNSMDPYFAIRDFGTGLSQEDLETVYTTYGKSTRSKSNLFNGALGLGSKTPFAYTDMFSVVSYFNGVQYTYTALRNEENVPVFAFMTEEETDEPNGLEVKLEVRPGDHDKFINAAKRIYRFFDPCPNITGVRVEIPDPEPVLEGENYKLFEMSHHAAGLPSRINVVMGNICYAADGIASANKLGHGGTLVLFADMGEVEFSSGREELRVTDDNQATVQARIDAALIDAHTQIEEKLEDITVALERAVAIGTYSNLISIDESATTIKLKEDDKYSMVAADIHRNKLYFGRNRWDRYIQPRANSTYSFIENDLHDGEIKQGDKNRLRHWMRESRNKSSVFICEIEDQARFAEVFGEVTIKMSALPKVPRQGNNGGYTGPRSFVKELTDPFSGRQSDKWSTILEDEIDTAKAIAVPRQGFNVLFNNSGREIASSLVKEMATLLGYDTIYGIANKHFGRLCEELELDSLEEKVREFLDNEVSQLTKYDQARYLFNFSSRKNPSELLNAISGLSTVCDDLIAMSKAKEMNWTVQQLLTTFEIVVPETNTEDFQETFRKRYPLLVNIDLSYAVIKDVTDYIKMIEKNKGN